MRIARMTALELMERARDSCTPPSWYQLARELKTTPQQVNTWLKRGGAYTEDAAWLIDELLQLPDGTAIAIREASREKNEERRERWRHRLKRIGGAMMIAAAWLIPSHYDKGGAWASSPSTSLSPSLPSKSESRETTRPELTFLPIIRRWLGRVQQLCQVGFGRFPAFGS